MKYLSFVCLLLFFHLNINAESIIIDSQMTFEEATKNTMASASILQKLALVDVEYYSFDSKVHRGQLVINKEVRNDIIEIFQLIKKIKFPIAKVIPIVKYNWSDSASMADNNTSAFNYRFVSGTKKLSNHALGLAVDINPFLNPYRGKNGKNSPLGSKRNLKTAGTLTDEHAIVREFLKRGWKWGGNYKSIKDWHHFDKTL